MMKLWIGFCTWYIDDDEEAATSTRPIVYRTYSHSGRFWHTPKTFALPPRMKLDTGRKIWCHGIPRYQITADETGQLAPIRPFRHFKSDMLPKHICQSFNLHWRPIFEVMEACPRLDLADEDLFECGIAVLKSRVDYVFNKRRAKPMQWELSTWSKHVHHSSIEKNGTESGKAALPTGTSRYNKPRKTGTFKRKRKPSDHKRRSRQPPRRQRTAVAALSALPNDSSSPSSDDEELPESPTRQPIRSAAIRAAAKVAAAAEDDSSSNSSSSRWESPPPEQPELPESPRRSTLRSAARVAAKKAARKVEEDEKTEIEDEEWGRNVLNDMIDKLGTRKEGSRERHERPSSEAIICTAPSKLLTCRRGWEPSDDDQKCHLRFWCFKQRYKLQGKCAPSGRWRTRERILCSSEM
jgi:hypothetical protein